MVAGVCWLPVTPSPPALAESAWISSSFDDFNGTGAWFKDCELNGTGGEARIVLKATPDWVQKNPAKPPAARAFCGLAAIDTDDKAVLFGGTDWSGDMGDTWVYDLGDARWTEMAPADSPAPREYMSLATVFGDDKAVLFGGFAYDENWWPVNFNDTWVYDLSDNAWYNRTPAVSPPPSAAYAMATVSGTDTIVLFTGISDLYTEENPKETWTYDISDNVWTKKNPPACPSARHGAGMAAVWNDDKVVLFGGYNDTSRAMGDTWVYDLSDDRWYEKAPASKPSPRYFTALATRYGDDKVLLFGGFSDDTWVYDLGDDLWTLQTPSHRPATRMAPGMATVARTDKTVLFGGEYADVYQETWVWDPAAFARSGEYRSPLMNVGGPAYFLMLNWTASAPEQTTVKFQVRTADTDFNLTWRNFTGPDGLATSFYTGESAIWSSPGDLWVQYRALLSTGNASATPALEEVRIGFDRFPSAPELLGPPAGLWANTTSPVFSWRFNDTDTEVQGMFEWQLDRTDEFTQNALRSGDVGAPDTEYTHNRPLAEGMWYWRVRTADLHGWGPFSGARPVGVDITPPSAFTPFVDPAKWTAGQIDLIFLTEDNVSGVRNFTVFIDNKPWGERESPWTLPELPDGTRNIVVRATDWAGNWAEGRTKAFVDRTPPADFTPESTPANWTKTMPQITFSTKDNASGVDHYEVRVDNGQFFVRSSPFSPPELNDGEHEVTVRAVDRAGNSVQGTVKVYIDRSKPDPVGVGVDPPGWTARDQTVTFWTQDPTSEMGRYEVSVDGGPFAIRESPLVLSGLGDGEHTITVRAYDLGGNFVEGQAKAFSDRTPPEQFTVSADPAGWSRQMPVVSFRSYDNHSPLLTYKASVDNGTFGRVGSPWTPSGLPDGARFIEVRAYDEAGNFASANTTVSIDTAAPDRVVLTINGGSGSTQSRKVRLGIAVNDSGSGPGRMCFSDDGVSYTQWEPFSAVRAWKLPSGSGGKAVYVKVQDAVGNEARPASATINYAEPAKADTTTPVALGLFAAIVIAGVALSAAIRLRRRKAPPPPTPPAPPAGPGAKA
jgi:hypothetical protein